MPGLGFELQKGQQVSLILAPSHVEEWLLPCREARSPYHEPTVLLALGPSPSATSANQRPRSSEQQVKGRMTRLPITKERLRNSIHDHNSDRTLLNHPGILKAPLQKRGNCSGLAKAPLSHVLTHSFQLKEDSYSRCISCSGGGPE